MSERERERGMKGKNSGVTERAVYWPRKCSQAAGQSAWLVPPVSLTAHWPMKAGLYSPFQSTAHTIKEEPFIFPFHRPHTQLPPQTPDPSPLFPFLSLHLQFVSLSPKLLSHNKKRTNKNLVQQTWRLTESNSFWFPLQSHKTVAECLQSMKPPESPDSTVPNASNSHFQR